MKTCQGIVKLTRYSTVKQDARYVKRLFLRRSSHFDHQPPKACQSLLAPLHFPRSTQMHPCASHTCTMYSPKVFLLMKRSFEPEVELRTRLVGAAASLVWPGSQEHRQLFPERGWQSSQLAQPCTLQVGILCFVCYTSSSSSLSPTNGKSSVFVQIIS